MFVPERKHTVPVQVGSVTIGGGRPIAVQSMTTTDTADAAATAAQVAELFRAGSELVRITVNTQEAAAAVPEVRSRLQDEGLAVPRIGDGIPCAGVNEEFSGHGAPAYLSFPRSPPVPRTSLPTR